MVSCHGFLLILVVFDIEDIDFSWFWTCFRPFYHVLTLWLPESPRKTGLGRYRGSITRDAGPRAKESKLSFLRQEQLGGCGSHVKTRTEWVFSKGF